MFRKLCKQHKTACEAFYGIFKEKINYVMMQTVYHLCKGFTSEMIFHIKLLYVYAIEMNAGKLLMTMLPGSIQS